MTTPTVDIAGIDLGTTNSVIAIPGQYPDKGQVYGPVTIIFDEVERLIQASAVCALDETEVIVGEDAKAMAEEGYLVTRFWKKYMGTKETYPVGNEQWTPEKLSAAVLKKMVSIAEEQLGIKIKRAVITHPAYFDALAINATREAARDAGIDADRTLQMEPVAAAMAYTYEDERPNIRVLVYDLGGGTFDITLVERTSGNMNPTSFGGDRELGGYNFDKKITTKMLAALREKGYELKFDPDNPENDSRWTTLFYYAEQLKHKLTDSKKADIRKNGVFKDDSTPPKTVQLSFSLTEAEFREMIESDVAKTIEATKDVLKKAGQTAADVDYLVLVGGSSRIPAIRERLQQEFGLEPQFDEDVLDLSVAAGAAMMAATSGSSASGVFLNHIPKDADVATLAVSGRVEASEENPDPENFTITVAGGASEEVIAVSESDGGFYAEVELFEDDENELNVIVTSPAGAEIFNETYVVTHNEDSSPPPPPPIPPLPKPICIATASGLIEVAAENVPLPYENTSSFQTVRELTEIHIEIFQEDIQLSTFLLKDFSSPVPPRCGVDLKVKIDTDYSLTVTADVPTEKITKTHEVQLTQPVIPGSEILKEEYQDKKSDYDSALENTPDGPTKARVAAEADRIIEEIEELILEEHLERMQLYMLLKKLMLLTKELLSTGRLSPSKNEMDKKFAQVRKLLPQAEAKDDSIKNQDYGATLNVLEGRASEAAAALDAGTWQQISSKLDDLIQSLEDAMRGNSVPANIPDAPILKMQFDAEIARLKSLFASKKANLSGNVAKQVEEQLQIAQQKLSAVDVSSSDAQSELIGIYMNHLKLVDGWLSGPNTPSGSDLPDIDTV